SSVVKVTRCGAIVTTDTSGGGAFPFAVCALAFFSPHPDKTDIMGRRAAAQRKWRIDLIRWALVIKTGQIFALFVLALNACKRLIRVADCSEEAIIHTFMDVCKWDLVIESCESQIDHA